MNPIVKLTIENFQSHLKTTITPAIDGQLTVITGPSDSGKTVILRALRWLLYNEPQGSDFIRVGASFARITAEFASGHTVIRERTRATNRYKIITPGADGPQVFEGFGISVPAEVQEITGVRPVQIGDLTINLNFAEQLAGPFLGSSISAGARAKVLGKLAGTEEIDFAAKQLGTDLSRRNQDTKRMISEVAELGQKLQEYDWLPTAKAKIETLEQLVTRIIAAQDRRNRVSQYKEQLTAVNQKITDCQTVLYKWRNLSHAEQLVEAVKTAQEKRNKLVHLENWLSTTDTEITVAQSTLYRWHHLKQAEQLVTGVTNNQSHLDLLVKLADDYWTYQFKILDCEVVVRKYADMPEAETKLQAAQDAAEKAKRLYNLKTIYLSTQELIQVNQHILSRLQGIEQVGSLTDGIQEKLVRRDTLRKLARSYNEKDLLMVQEQAIVKALQRVTEAEKFLQINNEKRQQREQLIALRGKHSKLNYLIESTREQVVMLENRVLELEGAYQDELAAAGVCPLCGQTTNFKEVV